MPGERCRAEEVNLELSLQCRVVKLLQTARHTETGIVDQNVARNLAAPVDKRSVSRRVLISFVYDARTGLVDAIITPTTAHGWQLARQQVPGQTTRIPAGLTGPGRAPRSTYP
jgi:hypothetical protein